MEVFEAECFRESLKRCQDHISFCPSGGGHHAHPTFEILVCGGQHTKEVIPPRTQVVVTLVPMLGALILIPSTVLPNRPTAPAKLDSPPSSRRWRPAASGPPRTSSPWLGTPTALFHQKPFAEPQDRFARPEASIARPEAGVARPEAVIARPEASIARPEASIPRPEACILQPEASIARPEAGIAQPEAGFAPVEDDIASAKDITALPEIGLAPALSGPAMLYGTAPSQLREQGHIAD